MIEQEFLKLKNLKILYFSANLHLQTNNKKRLLIKTPDQNCPRTRNSKQIPLCFLEGTLS